MKKVSLIFAVMLFASAAVSSAFDLDKALKDAENTFIKRDKGPDESTKASGLKEALSIGTNNAVKYVSRADGYFRNPSIKIPLPPEIKSAADTLSRMGFQKQVDEFILSMNRGAEKAAPKAVSIFGSAIKG